MGVCVSFPPLWLYNVRLAEDIAKDYTVQDMGRSDADNSLFV